MKIRTQLLLGAALFGAVLLVIAASVAMTTAELDRIEGQATLTGRIVTATNDLDYIANEYLLYGEPKQLDYWSGRYAALSADIANLSADSPEQQALVRAIADDQQRLQAVFDGIVASSGSGSPASADQGAFQVAWSRVGVQSQALVYDASRLSALLEDEADGLRFRNSLLIVALLGAFVLLLLVGFAVVGGRTLRSVNALQAGADAIGAGDLGHRIDASSDDEVGDLARSFNRMAGDLATVTASRAELEAAQAELRSVALFPLQNPHPVLRADRDGRLLFSNPAGAALLGNLRVGRPLPEPLCRVTREACAGGTRRTTEQGFGPTTYAIAVVPLPELGYVNLYFADVTERKAAEEAVAERGRLFSQAFHGNPAALAITRAPEYRYVDVNESWTDLFGHTRDEAIGRTSKELGMFPENNAEREAVVHQTLEQGAVRNREINACTRTGKMLSVLSSSDVVVIDGEKHILSSVIDVTERRRAEDERELLLRTVDANRRQLQALMDAIPAGVFVADATGRLVQVNEYAKRIWAGMLPADSWHEYAGWKGYWPHTGAQLTADEWATTRALTTGEAVLDDIVDIERFDGSRGTILNCAAPVTDADGTVVGAITINLDISEQRQTEALLREREQTLQSIFRAAPVGIGIASHRVIGSANEHLCAITGYAEDELIGQDARMLYLSDEAYASAGEDKSAQTLENGIGAVETQWRRKDGTVIDILLSSSPMDPSTPFENVVFIALDVTDLHAKEAALRESEAKYRNAVELSPDAILIHQDGRIVFANPAAAALLGADGPGALAGRPIFDIIHPGTRELAATNIERDLRGEESPLTAIEILRDDGTTVPVQGRGAAIPYGGRPAVQVVLRDITEERRAQQALRESEERYRELVEQAGSIIIRYDRDGRLTFVNEFAQRFFGFSAGELLGRTAIGTIIPETESSTGRDLAEMVRDIVRSPETFAVNENENITKDGRRVWLRWANRPIVGPDGEVREFLAIGTDITGRRATEAALAVSEEKYRHLFLHDITGDFIAAADGRILDCNPAFARMFGFASVEEALSSNIAETYTTPEDRPALLDRVRHEGMVQYDARFRRRVDGTDIHVVENILGRFDDDGALVETQGYIIEDTERYRAEEELRQSYEWFRVMGEALPYGVWRCNPRGGAEYTSQSFLDLLEMTEDEMREFGWTHRLPPDEVAPMLERWMHCVETGEDWDDEHHVLGPDGVYHTVLTRGRPVRDRDGAIVAWVGINLDIDERKRAEEALAESEANMARAQSTAHLGNWAWDLATNVISCSDEHCRLYGLAPGDYPIETFIDLVHEDDRQPIRDAIAATLNEGRPYDVECRVVRPDGVERVLHGEGEALRDQDGRVTGMFGIAQDITERKAAEMALAADLDALTRMHALSGRQVEREGLEPLLQEIMETAVAIMGAEKGTLQLAEGGSLRIAASFGHDEPFLTFFAAAEARASACGLAMAQRDRVVVPDVEVSPVFLGTGSLAVLRAAGVRAVQSTPLLSRAGELVGVLTTQWAVPYEPDEHDLWRLDLLARQAADLIEHARAVDALRAYAEDLRRSNEDLERYAYVSSHDLQEPLRSIVSFAQLLERKYRGKLGQDADDYIAFIVEGGNRMQTLILDLLAYSRVNSTAQERRPTDVEAVIAAVERHLDLQLREAAATVTHDPMPTVTADPLQLEQVFENLVSNAVKFRRPDVPLRIHVGARRMDGSWEFSVRDNGIGIEPEYFDRIFVIFQRLHTKEAYPGTGIGLAIVKRIIDRHGGRIRVESTPGEGTTFFFTLPAA